jgi:hypothetical protein
MNEIKRLKGLSNYSHLASNFNTKNMLERCNTSHTNNSTLKRIRLHNDDENELKHNFKKQCIHTDIPTCLSNGQASFETQANVHSDSYDDDDISNITDDEFDDDDDDNDVDHYVLSDIQYQNSYFLANYSVLKYVV